MDGWMNGLLDKQIYKKLKRAMGGGMDTKISGQLDGGID